MQDVRQALVTFFANTGGPVIKVKRGDLIRVDHPLYETHAQFFGDPTVRFETAVSDEVRSLDLSHMEEEEHSAEVTYEVVSEDLSLEELRRIAADLELPTYGAKPALVERINKKRGV